MSSGSGGMAVAIYEGLQCHPEWRERFLLIAMLSRSAHDGVGLRGFPVFI